MKKNFNPIISVEDDGLKKLEAHKWAEKKYKLVGGYCDIFTRGMRKYWDKLVYIDLFSGPGISYVKENNKLLRSSPLISLSIPQPFDVYIFCEENAESMNALEMRVKKDFYRHNTDFLEGDCNLLIEKIKSSIPAHSKGTRVLTFCFADPFNLNLKFETIKYLSSNKLVDLLILQAYYMDANRNFQNYINENNQKIALYLNDLNWREKFQKSKLHQKEFVQFLAYSYENCMRDIGYNSPNRDKIQIPIKNVPLYYLEFYSKHEKGHDLYKKVQYYADDQISLEL